MSALKWNRGREVEGVMEYHSTCGRFMIDDTRNRPTMVPVAMWNPWTLYQRDRQADVGAPGPYAGWRASDLEHRSVQGAKRAAVASAKGNSDG